jgi:hypothetical protein
MILNQDITLRPSQTYLFSYVWLALEMFAFNFLIHYFITSHSLFVLTFFMLCFARLYYWLDFSPETGFQTLFILGLIPLNWILMSTDYSAHLLPILAIYCLLLIVFGIFRIAMSSYIISGSRVIVQSMRPQSFEVDTSRSIELQQNSRGKLLNFGCILIPVIESYKPTKHFLWLLSFHQRYNTRYSGYLRIDGIKNPKEVIQSLKTRILK